MTAKKSTLFALSALLFGFLSFFYYSGFLGNQQGLMIEPITSSLGIARTVYSTVMMGGTITVTVLSMFFAKTKKTLGLKLMMIVGALGAVGYCGFNILAGMFPAAAVVLILLSQISLGVAFGWAGLTTITILVNNWAAKNHGLVISVISAMAGVGGIIAAPLVNSWIMNSGWEFSMFVRIIVSIAVLVIVVFLVKENPSEKDGILWEGSVPEESVAKEASIDEQEATGIDFEVIKKTKNYWFAIFSTFGFGMFIYPAFVSLAAHITDIGHQEVSGFAMSVVYFSSIIITLPLGTMMEKFGCRKILSLMLILMMAGVGILSLKAISVPLIYVAAACIGVGYSTFQVPHPVLAMEMGGKKSYIQIQSILFSAMNIGMMISVPIFNIFYDMTGSYRLVFGIDVILLALNIFCIFVATSKIKGINI